jgi:hypothetical protein
MTKKGMGKFLLSNILTNDTAQIRLHHETSFKPEQMTSSEHVLSKNCAWKHEGLLAFIKLLTIKYPQKL